MSHSSHNAHTAAEIAVGALQELASRGGMSLGHPHGGAKLGQMAVGWTAAVAPVLVAKAGAVTAVTLAAGSAAAAAAAPVLAVTAAGYGVYKLVKWLTD
jgi:hypothetical protein